MAVTTEEDANGSMYLGNYRPNAFLTAAPISAGFFTTFTPAASSDFIFSAAVPLLPEMIATGKAPEALIEEKGLTQVSDEGVLKEAVARVLEASPEQVATYRAGKKATLSWLVGQVMKATSGKANPAAVSRLLREALDG